MNPSGEAREKTFRRERALEDPSNFRGIDTCALCGSGKRRERFEEGIFSVVECTSCGLVYVTPRLRSEALPLVYGEGYWSSESPKDRGYADYRSEAPLYLATFERRMTLVRRHRKKPGRALDIGCAAGFFLRVLRDHGWKVSGVELSPEIGAMAVEALGGEAIHLGTLDGAPFEKEAYDLVSLWDVIEHVEEPVPFLEEAASFLKPDGILILETQNIDSLFARVLGPKWQHFKHLEHLYHFSPRTIRRLFQEAGLEVLESTSRFGGKYINIGFLRERATRVHPILSFLLLPLKPFDGFRFYANPRDEMVLVGRRTP